MRRSMKKGFTLIELLIVVVIIGILAAVAIPKFSNTKQRASRSAGVADMRNLATAQEGFFADSNRYAGTADIGTGPGRMNWSPSNGNGAPPTGSGTFVLVATPTGWSADMSIPGAQRCGIFSGNAVRPTGMNVLNPEGVPTCWP